jgi:negative regulator of sigma-B (phosphoserine phosphatase)
MRVELGSASRPKAGEVVCGDLAVAVTLAGGTLICLADGLGHGEQAKIAAERACAFVEAQAETPLEPLLRGLDRALIGSRGAAVSLLALRLGEGRLDFTGVGNVELRAISAARIAPPTMPGIVGQGFRRTRVWDYPLSSGSIFALTSDGISSRYDLAVFAHMTAQEIADGIVAQHRKSHDDACAIVARISDD